MNFFKRYIGIGIRYDGAEHAARATADNSYGRTT